MKIKLFIFLFLIISLLIYKELRSDDFSDAIVKAKKDFNTASNKGDKDALLKVRGEFERILQLKKNEWLINYYLAHVDFIISNVATEAKNNDDVKKYTESSLKLLDKSIELRDDFSETYILKMAVESMLFMYEPDKMNDIIAKQSEAKDKAEKLEPDNPRLYLMEGMNIYYAPEQFGGGADKALPLFQKSYDLFQTRNEKDETYPNWGTDMAPAMIALCYIESGNFDDAKKYIDKALAINPDSGFIKDYVQKEYDEKIKNK